MATPRPLDATAQAQAILRAWESRNLPEFHSALRQVRVLRCSSRDAGEQERWELLSEVAHQLRSTTNEQTAIAACLSLLKHLAQSSTPRSARPAANVIPFERRSRCRSGMQLAFRLAA